MAHDFPVVIEGTVGPDHVIADSNSLFKGEVVRDRATGERVFACRADTGSVGYIKNTAFRKGRRMKTPGFKHARICFLRSTARILQPHWGVGVVFGHFMVLILAQCPVDVRAHITGCSLRVAPTIKFQKPPLPEGGVIARTRTVDVYFRSC